MKKIISLIVILQLCHNFSFGQQIKDSVLKQEITYFLISNDNKVKPKIDVFFTYCQELQEKKTKFKNDNKFLKYVFQKTHRKFLKKYKSYSTLDNLFNKGYYDCVSGSTLYALIFEYLDYDVTIRETPFHIYLLLNVNNKQILIESTNYLKGFVTEKQEIKKMEEQFRSLHRQDVLKLYNRAVSIKELAGLQYFNFALFHFEQKSYQDAETYLIKAKSFYEIDKIKGLLELVQEKQRNIVTRTE